MHLCEKDIFRRVNISKERPEQPVMAWLSLIVSLLFQPFIRCARVTVNKLRATSPKDRLLDRLPLLFLQCLHGGEENILGEVSYQTTPSAGRLSQRERTGMYPVFSPFQANAEHCMFTCTRVHARYECWLCTSHNPSSVQSSLND